VDAVAVHLRAARQVTHPNPEANPGALRVSAASPAVAEMIARVSDPRAWERWARQVEHTGHCSRPVRLYGRAYAVDTSTGEVRATYASSSEPDGVLLVACKDRRAAVCPSCAETYRADTWHLVAAGLRGGRLAPEGPGEGRGLREQTATAAVPASVVTHPVVFATLTAPSFGPVHHTTGGGPTCRPRRTKPVCRHGAPLSCDQAHAAGDPVVGSPLCAGCYDYPGHVLWHSAVPELWRRTITYLYLALARGAAERTGQPVSARTVRGMLRVSFVKVAEWQRRAAIHLHAVIRLDGINPDDRSMIVAPPDWADVTLLEAAIRDAAERVSVDLPRVEHRERVAVWGGQLDIRPVSVPERAAAYVAKYATKTAGDTLPGLPATRLRSLDVMALRRRGLSAHAAILLALCFRLDQREECAGLRLAEHAHTLGFAGHFATKSRRYSTTLGALRAARRNWRANQPTTAADPWARDGQPGTVIVGDWRLVGVGYARYGDIELAATLTREHHQARQNAREVTGSELEGEP
jgi:hypothetical protein